MMLSGEKKDTKLYMQHIYVIHPAMSQLKDLKYVEFKHSQSIHVTHEPTRYPGSSADCWVLEHALLVPHHMSSGVMLGFRLLWGLFSHLESVLSVLRTGWKYLVVNMFHPYQSSTND